jgi:hypothetical protein
MARASFQHPLFKGTWRVKGRKTIVNWSAYGFSNTSKATRRLRGGGRALSAEQHFGPLNGDVAGSAARIASNSFAPRNPRGFEVGNARSGSA